MNQEHTADKDALRDVLAWAIYDEGNQPEWLSTVDGSPNAASYELADRVLSIVNLAKAQAWDEGHQTHRRLGPDGCECEAWNESECGCGLYGSNVITPNPYRVTPPVKGD